MEVSMVYVSSETIFPGDSESEYGIDFFGID